MIQGFLRRFLVNRRFSVIPRVDPPLIECLSGLRPLRLNFVTLPGDFFLNSVDVFAQSCSLISKCSKLSKSNGNIVFVEKLLSIDHRKIFLFV